MDTATEQAARNVVDAMVEAREMFSAFDVTSQIRQQGHQVTHRGMDGVRNFIHSNFIDNTGTDSLIPDHYVRTLHEFGMGPTFIFHPHDKDVNDYDPNKWQDVKTDDTTTVNDTVTTVADGKIGTDKRGRLCVRAKLVKKLGVDIGGRVAVFVANLGKSIPNEIRIVNARNAGIFPASVKFNYYHVDMSNGLRLSRRTLRKAFDGVVDQFSMDYETGSAGTFVRVKI